MIKKYFNLRMVKRLILFGLMQWLVTPSGSSFLFWLYVSHRLHFDPFKIRYVYFIGILWTAIIFRKKIGQFLRYIIEHLLSALYLTFLYGTFFLHNSKNKSHEDPLDKNSKQDP